VPSESMDERSAMGRFSSGRAAEWPPRVVFGSAARREPASRFVFGWRAARQKHGARGENGVMMLPFDHRMGSSAAAHPGAGALPVRSIPSAIQRSTHRWQESAARRASSSASESAASKKRREKSWRSDANETRRSASRRNAATNRTGARWIRSPRHPFLHRPDRRRRPAKAILRSLGRARPSARPSSSGPPLERRNPRAREIDEVRLARGCRRPHDRAKRNLRFR
jgi:hypothetical protein